MTSRARPRLAVVLLALLGGAAVLFAGLALLAANRSPTPPHPFFDTPLRNYAHRGGGAHAPESTLAAFAAAVDAGADALEMDVRLTADRALVVLHDPEVDRTTDGSGPVSEMTLPEVRRLNAGYRFRGPEGGFPFREAPERVPTFAEVLAAHPEIPFVVEMKTPDTADPLCEALRAAGRETRTLVGAFEQAGLDRFRRICPTTPTSAGFREAAAFLLLARLGLAGLYRTGGGGAADSPSGPDALLVSETTGPLTVVTPGFLRAARRRNLSVVVWTVNDPDDMRRLLDLGVDGILTDAPRTLERVLAERR